MYVADAVAVAAFLFLIRTTSHSHWHSFRVTYTLSSCSLFFAFFSLLFIFFYVFFFLRSYSAHTLELAAIHLRCICFDLYIFSFISFDYAFFLSFLLRAVFVCSLSLFPCPSLSLSFVVFFSLFKNCCVVGKSYTGHGVQSTTKLD